MWKLSAVVVCAIALGSCAQWRAEQQARRAAQQAQQDAADDAQCRSYGAQYGSNAYIYCRQRTAELHQRMAEQRFEAQQQAYANMTAAGLSLMQSATPPPPQPPSEDHVCVAANNVMYRC
jgi:hypothetical protein